MRSDTWVDARVRKAMAALTLSAAALLVEKDDPDTRARLNRRVIRASAALPPTMAAELISKISGELAALLASRTDTHERRARANLVLAVMAVEDALLEDQSVRQ